MHPSYSVRVLSTDEKWVLSARAEAATRSTATVLETPIAAQMTALAERDNIQVNLYCGKRKRRLTDSEMRLQRVLRQIS